MTRSPSPVSAALHACRCSDPPTCVCWGDADEDFFGARGNLWALAALLCSGSCPQRTRATHWQVLWHVLRRKPSRYPLSRCSSTRRSFVKAMPVIHASLQGGARGRPSEFHQYSGIPRSSCVSALPSRYSIMSLLTAVILVQAAEETCFTSAGSRHS